MRIDVYENIPTNNENALMKAVAHRRLDRSGFSVGYRIDHMIMVVVVVVGYGRRILDNKEPMKN